MAEVKGSYDSTERTWEDEDGARVRVTRFDDGHVVIRTSDVLGSGFSKYVDLNVADVAALIQHLKGE